MCCRFAPRALNHLGWFGCAVVALHLLFETFFLAIQNSSQASCAPNTNGLVFFFFFPSVQLFSSLFPFRCTPRPGQPSQPVRQFFCVVQRGSFYSVFFPKLADFLCGSFWLLYLFWPYFGRCSLFLGNFLHSCSLVQACLCFQQLFETRQAVSCQECGKGPAWGCLAPPSARTGAFPCQSCLFSLFSEPTLHALVELVARG